MNELADWLEHRITRTILGCIVYLVTVHAVRRVYQRLDELEVRAAMLRHPAGGRLSAVPSA